MNQAELTAAIAAQLELPKSQVEGVLGSLGENAQEALARGEEVTLPHLGKLKTAQRAARTARNPKTGETVQVPAKTVVKFTTGKDLRDALPKPGAKGKKKT